MNDEGLFSLFFDRALDKRMGIGWLLESPELPLEWCRKVLDRDIGTYHSRYSTSVEDAYWYDVLRIITCRPDLTKELALKCCEKAVNVFVDDPSRLVANACETMLNKFNDIPEEIMDFLDRNNLKTDVSIYIGEVPDSMKEHTLKDLCRLDSNDEVCKLRMYQLDNFLGNLNRIPDYCMPLLDEFVMEISKFKNDKHHPCHFILRDYHYLEEPLDDNAVNEALNTIDLTTNLPEMTSIKKVACNRSISDYGMMLLLTKVNDNDFLEEVNKFLDENKERREQYRLEHPEFFKKS